MADTDPARPDTTAGAVGPTVVELLDDNEALGAALVDIGMAVGLPRPSATCRWGAPEILDRIATLNAELKVATPNPELGVPPRAAARIAQARADQAEGYGSTTSVVEGLLRELDRRGAELDRLRAVQPRDEQPPGQIRCWQVRPGGGRTIIGSFDRLADAEAERARWHDRGRTDVVVVADPAPPHPVAAVRPPADDTAPDGRTDGQPPADPVQITRDPARVTTQVVQAVWDEEGPEGVADWIRDMTAAPADDTAAATAPWMVESRDERVDRLTRHVENVADCAGIEIEVREAGPLTGPAPLRRLVRALEGAGMLHDDPADDTAAPDQRHPQTVGSLAHAEAMFFRDHARRGYALLRGMARRSSELRRAGQPVRGSQNGGE